MNGSGYFNLRQFSSASFSFNKKPQAGILDGTQPDGNAPPQSPTVTDGPPELEPVDGKRAWLVVLGSFFTHLVVLGLLYSFGIFVVPMSLELGTTRAEIALVGTINVACFYVAGIYAGPVGDKFGVQPVMIAGAVVWVLGCILASFSVTFWQSILTHGIMIGLGASCCYWPCISVVPMWFDKYRGTAVGFATVGAGVGNLIFALGGQGIIEALGWRQTLRVMAGVGGCLLGVAILLVKRRVPPVQGKGLFHVARRLIHVRSYQIFLAATFFFQWGFFIPFIHLAAYVTDLGIAPTLGGLAVAMLGIGSTVGRLVTGPMGDLFGRCFEPVMGRLIVFRGCMFFTGVFMAIWPACDMISTILMFAFFYGFFAGGFIAQSPVVAADLWGATSLGGTFALLNLAMIPGALACGPLAGLAFQETGSYWSAIWAASGFILLSAFCLMFVSVTDSPRLNPPEVLLTPTTDSTPPGIQEVKGDEDVESKEVVRKIG